MRLHSPKNHPDTVYHKPTKEHGIVEATLTRSTLPFRSSFSHHSQPAIQPQPIILKKDPEIEPSAVRFSLHTHQTFITTQTEHKCVLYSRRHLQQEGFDITYLPVKADELIDLDQLRVAIRPDTGLVSIMAVNNEIGVIQPMEEIRDICKEFKIPFHIDAAQVLGKILIDVDRWNVSLMSLSGQKVYGPKGVGALYMRRRPRIWVEPQMNGGGQERGIRSGTVLTPLVVGMGTACAIAKKEMKYHQNRISQMQERMLSGIREQLDEVVVNGSIERRYPERIPCSFWC